MRLVTRFCSILAVGLSMMPLGAALTVAESNKTPVQRSSTQGNDFTQRTVTLINGEPVGILTDVVLDWKQGQPEFAVIKLADNIHPDAGFTAVPWSLLRFGEDHRRVQLLATKEQLRAAPKLDPSKISEDGNQAWMAKAREHFGAQGNAESAMSGTLRGSDSSGQTGPPTGGDYLGAGSRGASVAVYVGGALLLGIVVGRYLLYRRGERRPVKA